MNPFGASASAPAAEATFLKARSQRISCLGCPRATSGWSLEPPLPPHPLHGCAAIGPPGAPGPHGDDVATRLSRAANLTPRHKPDAAERSASESPQTSVVAQFVAPAR